MSRTERAQCVKDLEYKRERLASLEAEFEGWRVALIEMATLRNQIARLERRLAEQEQTV